MMRDVDSSVPPVLMNRIGPISRSSVSESVTGPTETEFEDSVYWAVSVENVKSVDFYFADRLTGKKDTHYQLLGPHHHLSNLEEERIKRARSIFKRYDVPSEELEPRRFNDGIVIDPSLPDIDPQEHVSIAMAVIEDVYNMPVTDIQEITRSTHSLERPEEETTKMAVCHNCATSHRVSYLLDAYGDVYYQATDADTDSGKSAFDFVFSKKGWWICKDCLGLRVDK